MQTIYNLKTFMTQSLVIVASLCLLTPTTEALSCNYEGSIYNICMKTNTNWSYENSAVCVGITRCVSQSPPYGVVATPPSTTPKVTTPMPTTPLPTTPKPTTPMPTTPIPTTPTPTTPKPTTPPPNTPAPPVNGQNLPIIFFHGVFGDPSSGNSLKARLPGRTWLGLDFCTGSCSVGEMNNQVKAAITQIRQKTQGNSAYANGYIFIAHSMGSIIARAVIEEMDDHKVKSFISLAGVANGIFYGPQQADATALSTYLSGMGSAVLPGFDFSKYSGNDKNGKFQYELNQATNSNDALQQTAGAEVLYSPAPSPWNVKNKFLPVVNNVNPCSTSSCTADQARRKANFLKLSEAHFFGSNADGVVAPWQTSILGKYSDVSTNEEIQSKFSSLTIVDMKNTREYTEDTYGLKTLDARGGLHTTAVNGIGHGNWLGDANIYNQYLAPIL